MKQAGRVPWILILILAGVAVIGSVFLVNAAGPQPVAVKFMDALAKQDIDKLTELSIIGNDSPEMIHKKWEETFKYAKYFKFRYQITDVVIASDNTANAKLTYWDNYMVRATTDKNFQIPMIKQDGKWKVHVGEISREMFPFLPR
ncbi:MAG: hypothetical protein JSS72_06245 [Armatimonadetes bacterium]|nr:hypothetical protein [Armatimonadota bacterium]